MRVTSGGRPAPARSRRAAVVGAVLMASAVPAAVAATASASFGVSATVVRRCAVASAGMERGSGKPGDPRGTSGVVCEGAARDATPSGPNAAVTSWTNSGQLAAPRVRHEPGRLIVDF